MYDVIVIGGGVAGCLILRELSKYDGIKSLLLESCDDVATGASRANSGIVHAGFDCKPGTLKAKFNVEGHAMYPSLMEELDVPYKMTGSLVVAPEDGRAGIEELYEKGIKNGVKVEIIGRTRILEIEPNVADDISLALYAPEAGVVSPYKLTIAAADNAVQNGAEIRTEETVIKIEKTAFGYKVLTEKGSSYECKLLINSAGENAVDINAMLDDEQYETEHRRGDYFVLDKKEIGNISTVLFPLPDHRGKGILVAPTADGNVIYGPTSILSEKGDTEVTLQGLDQIREGLAKTYKAASFRNVIRLFSGMRSAVGNDFIIKESEKNRGYIMLLGICSPGLTSSPSIAKYVVEELVSRHFKLGKKQSFLPLPKHKKIAKLDAREINALVEENPLWGRVVCRCETVSEAEIVNAIHSPLKAVTVDAVKRRVRAGMGRCQGGFCMPSVIKIISRELGIPLTAVKKGGAGSEIAKEQIGVNKK